MTFAVSNTPNGKAGIMNQEMVYKQDMVGEQQRVKITVQAHPGDVEFTQVMFETTIDTCKLVKGILGTSFSRIMLENLQASLNTNYSCNRFKGLHYKVVNSTYTDTFLPPMPVEVKFKLVDKVFSSLVGKKGLIPIFTVDIFGRFKK